MFLFLLFFIYITYILQKYYKHFPRAPIPLIAFLPFLISDSKSDINISLFLSVVEIFSATINGSKKSIKILAGDDAKLAPAYIKAS